MIADCYKIMLIKISEQLLRGQSGEIKLFLQHDHKKFCWQETA